jgi:hypothetical protein
MCEIMAPTLSQSVLVSLEKTEVKMVQAMAIKKKCAVERIY